MSVMHNKWMVVVMFVEPTFIIMVIGKGSPRTDGNQENCQDYRE